MTADALSSAEAALLSADALSSAEAALLSADALSSAEAALLSADALSSAEAASVTAGVTVTAAEVLELLVERAETVAVAESLTGGLLAATLVEVPGASRAFRGGLVVYATDLKATLAGVPAELLAAAGPVHPDVAAALAEGARRRCGAQWGLGTTGVAGPDAQDGIPVGTVYVAVSGAIGTGRVARLELAGSRAEIRAGAVAAALALLAAALHGSEKWYEQ